MINQKHMLAALLASALAAPASAELVVVVSAKNPTAALTAEQAGAIFLGQADAFPGGGKVVPLDQAESTGTRDEFYAKTTGKTSPQLKAYWSKQIFTGKGRPPRDAGDSNAVRTLVAANPNMIGYIDKAAVDGSVKVVLSLK